ncbi:hypothetical protein [Listeria rustica]|uniref:Uncharacterized protein n=1 Tax=Listeria rustica TaxID=2713503 RepID=A0A7W1T7J5_9LIST|nr:hypothetical protein [Listeria rustica]MBA3926903.1 hypothetical protein [Listeria rustica]
MKKKITGTLLIVGMSVLSLGGLLQNGQEVQATSAIGILPSPPQEPEIPSIPSEAEELSVKYIALNESLFAFDTTPNTREYTTYINNKKIETQTVGRYDFLSQGAHRNQIVKNLKLKIGDTIRVDSKDNNNILYTGKTLVIDKTVPLNRPFATNTIYAGDTQFTINALLNTPYLRIFINGTEIPGEFLIVHVPSRTSPNIFTINPLSTPLKKGDRVQIIGFTFNTADVLVNTGDFTTIVK